MAKKRKSGGGPFGTGPLKKGALHRQLGVPEDEKIPKSKLAAAKSGRFGKLAAKRAQAAETMSHFSKKKRKK